MRDCEVTPREFEAWIAEIRNGFFLDNYTSNPVLFHKEEIKNMPMLGDWSWAQFCTALRQDYTNAATNMFECKQVVKALQHDIGALNQNIWMMRKETAEYRDKKEREMTAMRQILDNQSTMLRNQTNMLSKILKHNDIEDSTPPAMQTANTTVETINNQFMEEFVGETLNAPVQQEPLQQQLQQQQHVMEFDALKSRIFKGKQSIQDIMFACIVDNIFVSWEMHKNKLKENKKKTDTKDQTDVSNIKKIHNLFVESLTDEDKVRVGQFDPSIHMDRNAWKINLKDIVDRQFNEFKQVLIDHDKIKKSAKVLSRSSLKAHVSFLLEYLKVNN